MIRFIDITTGNVFNGSQPYVFWFDKEQSVNLNYVRKICVLSTDEHLTVTLPENPVFCLLDTTKMGNDIELAGKKFKDLDNSGFKTFEFDSIGAPYNTFYVHMLYVLGRSSEAGEYRENLTIDDEVFTIGADFYNEREELSINLLNQGMEMPKLVEKAIYEFNIHEEGIDNILLNRKYKELLSEYINILGNKGSYKSLINSLNWFEYGDQVNMLDYWKHEEPTRTIYTSEEINQIVDKDIEDILTKSHKTTYIGLYLALTRTALDADGNIKYEGSVKYWDDVVNKQYGDSWESATTQKLMKDMREVIITDPKDRLLQIGEDQVLIDNYPDNSWVERPHQGSNWLLLDRYFDEQGDVVCREIPEPNPAIDFAAAKWSAIDLSLKMTMLGNFFSTYFMPLHLDLIHSTVENIVYANTIKFFSWHIWQRQDWNHDIETFSCDVGDKTYFMSDVKARVYPDTTFGDQYEEGKESFHIFGVEAGDRDQYVSAIVYDGDTFERDADKDTINMGNQYYAWDDYFTLTDSPAVGDVLYEYNMLSGFMLLVGSVEGLEYDGGYVFDKDTVKTYLEQRFEGPGVIIPFNCTLHNVQHGMYITEASIMVSHDGADELHHTYNVHNDPDEVNAKPESVLLSDNRTLKRNTEGDVEVDGIQYYAWGDLYSTSDAPQIGDHMYELEGEWMVLVDYDVIKSIYKGDRHINFNILLQDIGDYQFAVDFKCGNGMHYIKKFKFVVYDDTQQEVKMYKIVRRDWDEIKDILPKEKTDLLRFMFTQLDENDSLYRQFLATNDNAFLNKLGLNQVIIYEPQITWNRAADPTLTYHINISNHLLDVEGTYDDISGDLISFVDELNENPKYKFFLQERLGLRVDMITSETWVDDVDKDNVIKYNHSKNIAYLYDIVKRHEDESGIDKYYTIVPYIFGIGLQFDMNTNITLCKDKTVGAYKDGIKDIAKYSVTMDVNSNTVYLNIEPEDKESVIETWVWCGENRGNKELKWKEFVGTLPANSIIDDNIKIRFLLPHTQIIKEVNINVPRLMNLEYDPNNQSNQNNQGRQSYKSMQVLHLYNTWNIGGESYRVSGGQGSSFIYNYWIPDSQIDNENIGRLYLQHKFIPVFHTFIEVPDRKIQQNDVVCFLPDLNMVRNDRYNPIGWTFTNSTTHEEIQPLPYNRKDLYWDWDESWGPKPNQKDQLVDPLEPMLGRYDLKKIINPGYYNINLEYELVTDHDVRHRYLSNSEFIVEK